jgi:Monooxygenase af470-like
MASRTVRETVNLADYAELVVIYLGLRVNSLRGLRTLIQAGPRIQRSVAAAPDGLLRRESIVYSLAPPHVGMRQYWRDFDALERWTRADPHRGWWSERRSWRHRLLARDLLRPRRHGGDLPRAECASARAGRVHATRACTHVDVLRAQTARPGRYGRCVQRRS